MKPLISFAKNLRKRSTDTEKYLWKHLRAKRFFGLKFRRQEPIGRYIVDFVCYQKRIIIECDGGQHFLAKKDHERDQWFEGQGYRVLRFWDNDIFQNLDGVMEIIRKTCRSSPSPLIPSHQGRGKLKVQF